MSVRIHSERPDRRDQTRRRVDGDEVSSGWSGNRSWWNRRGRRRTDCNACRPSRKGCRRRLRAEDPRAAELIFLRSLREPRWRSGSRKPANQTIASWIPQNCARPGLSKEHAGKVAALPPLRAYGAAGLQARAQKGFVPESRQLQIAKPPLGWITPRIFSGSASRRLRFAIDWRRTPPTRGRCGVKAALYLFEEIALTLRDDCHASRCARRKDGCPGLRARIRGQVDDHRPH